MQEWLFLYKGDKKEKNILLYMNEGIMRKEQEELLESLNEIQEKVSEINQNFQNTADM